MQVRHRVAKIELDACGRRITEEVGGRCAQVAPYVRRGTTRFEGQRPRDLTTDVNFGEFNRTSRALDVAQRSLGYLAAARRERTSPTKLLD
jgi:hypothetical protein